MSIGIATLGMFSPCIGKGTGQVGGGGIIHVPEEKQKPKVRLISITTAEQVSKKKIEITSINVGEKNYDRNK